jgi:hypothetical protein
MASGGTDPLTRNLRNRWTWAVRFKSQGKWTGCFGGFQLSSGICEEGKGCSLCGVSNPGLASRSTSFYCTDWALM